MRAGQLSVIAIVAHGALAAADPRPGTCAGPTELTAADARVASANDRQLHDRLAVLRLAPLELPVDETRDDPTGPVGAREPHAHPWQPTRNPDGREVVEAEPFEQDCGPDRSPPLPVFARAADGTVYRIDVTRRVTARAPLLVCGCAPQPVSSCGVDMRWTVHRSWTLPAGAHYGGAKAIAIDVHALAPRYTLGGVQACPPPAQPPSAPSRGGMP